MAMAEAFVNAEMIRWARERASFGVDTFARKVHTKPEKVISWESGEARPTFKQAEKLAHVARIPFGYLFLPHPPEERLPFPDLRTRPDVPPPHLDADFMDLVQDVLFKFDWYRDFLMERGAEPLPFVGGFKISAGVKQVAADMAKRLGVDARVRREARNWEDYFRILCDRAEGVGVWVMRSGVVASNTQRPLSVDIFRGFAMADPIAPLVFVNGRDAKAAQIFTLAHELAHIWLGESGISDPISGREALRGTEARCNQIAAEFLVPEADFRQFWRREATLDENAGQLAGAFRVSRFVIALRALGLELIEEDDFDAFHRQEQRRWARRREEASGGDYYRTAPARMGSHFIKAVVNSAMSGEVLLRDAGALLNAKPKTIQEMYRRLGRGV
jgi:Zn-dependent peptidase ImmA (M78 family)/transcriptional regulator with XRE-family HTH domain